MSTGQVNSEAARVYEDFFVPALFAEWPPRVIHAAGIEKNDRVIDIACGTGVLTLAVFAATGVEGSVIGLDLNEGMLAVAASKSPDIVWRQGSAEELPFEDNSFDAVVSQFGLMFFQDKEAAIREMCRVLRPGGRLAVAVWASLESTPGYAAMVRILHRLFGPDIADQLRAPFALGDPDELSSLFRRAGITPHDIATFTGKARFGSVEQWLHTDIRGWTLADKIDDRQYESLLKEAQSELQAFVGRDNTISFDSPAHIVAAQKR